MANITIQHPKHGIANAVGLLSPKELCSKAQLAELTVLQAEWERLKAEMSRWSPNVPERELVQARQAFTADPSTENSDKLIRASDLLARKIEYAEMHQACFKGLCGLTTSKIIPAVKPVLARSLTILAREIAALGDLEADTAQRWGIPHEASETLASARALASHVESRIHSLATADTSLNASPAHLLHGILTVTATATE